MTFFAVIAQHASVKLQNLPAPRHLMKAVDILGDNRSQLTRPLQLRQLQMGGVGLGVQAEHLAAVKAEELLRVRLVEAVAEDGFRWIVVLLVVEPVGAAEIRNAALGAYSAPPKKTILLLSSTHCCNRC